MSCFSSSSPVSFALVAALALLALPACGDQAPRAGDLDSSSDSLADASTVADGNSEDGGDLADGGDGADGGTIVDNDAAVALVPHPFTVWHWNVAGSAMHKGSTTNGMVKAAVDSIINRDADFATFNELCGTQYRAIQTQLRQRGWPMDSENFSRFQTNLKGPNTGKSHCGEVNTGTYGNAIFSKRPLGGALKIQLPYDGKTTWGMPEHRGLLCVPLKAAPTMRICTTHLTTYVATKVAQLAAVKAELDGDGSTFILSGDLNNQPHYARLNSYYSSNINSAENGNNTGTYRELDDADPNYPAGTGEPTTESNTKIDFHFVPEGKLFPGSTYDADALSISQKCSGPCSDHRILIGHVTLTY